MTKKICLIIPPSPFLLDERVFMSLGILKVGAVLEKAGFKVEVIDLSGVLNPREVISLYLKNHERPEIFGLTTTTPQLPKATEIIREIRRQAGNEVRIILGGPHVTLVHAAQRKEQGNKQSGRGALALKQLQEIADVLVAGDGEKAIFLAMEKNSPKIVNADDPKGDLFLSHEDLDSLPWPNRDLIEVGSYHYTIDGVPALSLVSQLGCPFGCGFCGGRNSPSLRRMRSRSPQNILAEMEHLYLSYGTKGFMFYDDELNVNRLFPVLLKGIIDLQKNLGVEFRLRGFIKSQLFTEEQAELMFQAGFRWILVGFESGSPLMLANMNKRATVEENTRCVQIARKYGLKVKALMSLGHPGESLKTIDETRNWLLEVKPDDFDVTVITVYPGTPYYDESVPCPQEDGIWVYTTTQGDRLYSVEVDYREVADFYKGDPNDGYKSFVFTNFLSQQEIVAKRNELEEVVRRKLGIPYPSAHSAHSAQNYEHSMGQSLPSHILSLH